MRRAPIVLACLLFSLPSAANAIQVITPPTLGANATWGPTGSPPDNEYWIQPSSGSTFTIPVGVTLTIQPGTTVRIDGGVSIIVNGTLSASGTGPSPTVFDVTPAFSQWGGIQLAAASASTLSGCTIQNFGTYPVYGTITQVGNLFQTNTFVPRGDGHFNAIRLRGGTLTTSATLGSPPAGFCYITDGNPVVVAAVAGPVLTIADFTVIKFQPGDYLQIGPSNTGGLKAHGVVFTSSQDDTLGHTDGNASGVGAPNQWRNLRFEGGTLAAQTVVDGCTMRYGGDTDAFGVLVRNAQPTLTQNVIASMNGVGLRVDGTSTGAQITGTLLRGSTQWELAATPQAMANLVPNSTVEASGNGMYNGYRLVGATITANLTLPRPPVGFCYITEGSAIVVQGAGGPVLTIADLTVMKFQPGDYLQIGPSSAGGLKAHGVVFTSSQDDTLGHTDGNPSGVGAPNQWRNLRFEGGTLAALTAVDSCMMRYGGDTDAFGVLVRNAQPTLTRNVIASMNGVGLRVDGSSTGTPITGTLLSGSTQWELAATPQAMANLVPNNTVLPSGNGMYNGYRLVGATITSNLTLPRPPVGFCYITEGNAIVVQGAGGPVLTIADFTVIKFQPGDFLQIGPSSSGGLKAHAVVFTSSQDDTLGHTDGNPSGLGAPNQWRNLRFEGGTLAAQTVVDGCTMRYGGDTDAFGVLVRNAQPTLTHNVIASMNGVGLRVDGSSTGTPITGTLLRGSTQWELAATPQAMANLVPNNTVELSGNGRYNGYRLVGATITANLTLPRPPVGFCYITEGNPIVVASAGGPVLTIADLTVMKFQPGDYLQIGPSSAGGLKAHAVVFTSSQDDTLGHTDGNASGAGAPNQWRNLRFEGGTLAAQTVVDGCTMRYGGDTDGFGVLVNDAQPTLTHNVIVSMNGRGIRVQGAASGAQITGNLFRNSTTWEISGTLPALMNLVPANRVLPSGDTKFNGYELLGSTAVGALTLPRPPVGFPYYMTSSITVPAGSSLQIPAGVIVKLTPGAQLTIAGTLTTFGKVDQPPYDAVIFTSYRDDAWWGDTNGDGPSTGAAGDWQRLELDSGGNSSVVNGVIFEFGGGAGSGQLLVNGTGTQANPNVRIKNCHFRLGLAVGGVRTLNSNALLDSCSFFGTSGLQGVTNSTTSISVIASNSWWGHATGPHDASLADPCSNPSGQGVGVSDFVNYCPFLSSEAPVTDAPPTAAPITRTAIVSFGPVPSTGGVTMVVDVAEGSRATIEVMDVLGRSVAGADLAGQGGRRLAWHWDGTRSQGERARGGVYFVRFRHDGSSEVRRLVLSR